MTDHDQPPSAPLRVTIKDLRTARYCLAGARPWFQRHGFAWPEFLTHGIEAERLRATNDALVDPVIRAAEMRTAALAATGAEAPDGRA